MARYEPPNNGGDEQTAYTNSVEGRKQRGSTPWYRRSVVLLGVVLAILTALILLGIVALFTGNQGGTHSITPTTTTAPTTTSAPTTTTSGGFHLPSLPSKITLPSVITLPPLP